MPGFDGTGPVGFGPRTGGGRGYCPPGGQYKRPYGYGIRYALRGAGRGGIPWGCGRGRVFGGGRGRGWYGPSAYLPPAAYPYSPFAGVSPDQEVDFLKNRAAAMEQELEQIRRRIETLQKTGQE